MNIKLFVTKLKRKLRGGIPSAYELRMQGAVIGDNCHIYGHVDSGHEWLVTIGNNVTLATGCRILTHDGSTKKILGYSKVGRVDIGDDVFIGAQAIVLPNVKIGNRVIIGAGSVVTQDIPDDTIAVGNPARIVGKYVDFVRKNELLLKNSPIQNNSYLHKTQEEKQQLKEALLVSGYGFDL